MRAALGNRLAVVRAAAWAARASVAARRQLKTVRLEAIELPPAPGLPRHAGRGVQAVLRHAGGTCLERALVRQRWLAGQGVARDLVIGVAAGPPFSAHAWLDGDAAASSDGFQELGRLRA